MNEEYTTEETEAEVIESNGGEALVMTEEFYLPSVEEIEERVTQYQGILRAVLKLTKPQDWVKFSSTDTTGRKWEIYRLDGFGAKRLMRPLGISVSAVSRERISMEDDKGSFYLWVYSGVARMGGNEFYVEGRASSRDKFFAIKDKQLKPLSDVDQKNIMTAAYNELLKKAVVNFLGLGNFTLEDLKELGFDTSKLVRGHEFKGGKSGKSANGDTGKATDAQVSFFRKLVSQLHWGEEQTKKFVYENTKDRLKVPAKASTKEMSAMIEKLKELTAEKKSDQEGEDNSSPPSEEEASPIIDDEIGEEDIPW
tara:strand:- start:4356 stop:5285 length:930 start_codon:yes stop_codon:yes gene_type:complete